MAFLTPLEMEIVCSSVAFNNILHFRSTKKVVLFILEAFDISLVDPHVLLSAIVPDASCCNVTPCSALGGSGWLLVAPAL